MIHKNQHDFSANVADHDHRKISKYRPDLEIGTSRIWIHFFVSSLTERCKKQIFSSDGWLHLAASRPGRGIHGLAVVFCPTSVLSAEGWGGFLLTVADMKAQCSVSVHQVPEWTKCSSREKRKEKKVEKPFYSDSEGESGPTESADSGNVELWHHHVLSATLANVRESV